MIPSVDPSIFSEALAGKQAQGQGKNGFQIPDLSQLYPDQVSPYGDLPTFSNKPGKLLTGSPVAGDPSGHLTPLNVNKLEKLSIQADQLGYNMSDQDFAARFPELVKARDANIASAGTNLAGQQDPFITNALQSAGLGDIDLGTGEHTIERNMGVKIGSKEQRDRTYFQRLLQENPVRAFGLNSKDVERIALANTNGVNMTALGLAQNNAEQAIANAQSSGQDTAGIISALGSLGSAGVKAATSSLSPQLSPSYYAPPAAPAGFSSGASFGYGDPYSGNFYDNSGNYVGNTITGTGG